MKKKTGGEVAISQSALENAIATIDALPAAEAVAQLAKMAKFSNDIILAVGAGLSRQRERMSAADFKKALTAANMSPRTAQRYMEIHARFGETGIASIAAELGVAKLAIIAEKVGDDEVALFAREGKLHGAKEDELQAMSPRGLQLFLELQAEQRAENADHEREKWNRRQSELRQQRQARKNGEGEKDGADIAKRIVDDLFQIKVLAKAVADNAGGLDKKTRSTYIPNLPADLKSAVAVVNQELGGAAKL